MTSTCVTRARHMYITCVFCVVIWLCFCGAREHRPSSEPSPEEENENENKNENENLQGVYMYSDYQPYDKIVKELKRIEKTEDTRVKKTLFSIGTTFENRTLWAVRFQEVGVDKVLKKTIIIDCGAHAREWIAPSTCMYLINELTLPKSALRKVLKKYDWVIIPLLNPDGYVYSWKKNTTGARFWRKNRSYDKKQLKKFNKTGDPMCIGVDINRNFNKNWGGVGAPTINPCHEMYAGSEPFSEKESTALAKYMRKVENDVIAYLTLHCYGQMWMTPWGYKSKSPGEYKEMRRVAKLAVAKMRERSGTKYDVGKSHDLLYPHSGSSADWVYGKLDIPYSYLVEMIPRGEKFDLPASAMVKNAKDITEGIFTMALNLKKGKTKS